MKCSLFFAIVEGVMLVPIRSRWRWWQWMAVGVSTGLYL